MSSAPQMAIRCSAPLTIADAEAGIAALQENAARLARDATLMLQARRYAAAAALAASSLTEIARIPVLLELAHAQSERQRRHFWSKFHEGVPVFAWSLFRQGASPIDDADMNRMVSFIGSAGTRIECLDRLTWTTPDALIKPDLAKELVRSAELFAAHPPDRQTLRLWLEVVSSFPKNTHDSRIFQRFKERLDAQGFNHHACMVTKFQQHAGAASPAE